MKLRYLFSLSIIAAAAFLAACGSAPETPVNNANTANAPKPANANVTNSNPEANVVAVTTPTPDSVSNKAPTLTPVYKAYCAAVVKKDDAAIRKFFDSATLKEFDAQMKDAGIKRLSEFVDPVTNEICEVTNEQFKGDKAVARVKTISYGGDGYSILWLKEGGEWKMSSISPEKGF